MKKFILALVVAVAAVFPAASSAANDDSMMNILVTAINSQDDPSVSAAWDAPYLTLNVKLDEAGCAELNQLLKNPSTASAVKEMMMEQFLHDSEMLGIIVELEKYGLKGIRFNITDSLGVKSTFILTVNDIRKYAKAKGMSF